jgi:hypothetical protein
VPIVRYLAPLLIVIGLLIVSPLGGMVFALTGSQIKILYLGSNTPYSVTTGGGGGPNYYDWQPTEDIDRALRDLGYRNYVVTIWSPESVERDPAKRLENFSMIIYWAGANPNPLVFNINEYPNLKEKLSFFLEKGGILLIDGASPSSVGIPTKPYGNYRVVVECSQGLDCDFRGSNLQGIPHSRGCLRWHRGPLRPTGGN